MINSIPFQRLCSLDEFVERQEPDEKREGTLVDLRLS
jgi:hypothetical protein